MKENRGSTEKQFYIIGKQLKKLPPVRRSRKKFRQRMKRILREQCPYLSGVGDRARRSDGQSARLPHFSD